MGDLRARTVDLSFYALVALAAVVLLVFGRELTFFFDDWQLILVPEALAPHNLLNPHNGQLIAMPRVIYGVLLDLFGMTSQLPFRAINVAAASTCALLLYFFIRRRIEPILALVLLLPVLVLGVAWEALLLSLSMNFLLGLAAGLGMLLVLESKAAKADLVASLLLVTSLACGGIGLAFVAAAAADVLTRRDPRRLWIPGVPLLLIGLWYLLGGESSRTDYFANLLSLPDYVWKASRAAVGAASGVTAGRFSDQAAFLIQSLLVVLCLTGIAARFTASRVPVSRETYVVAAALLAFWLLGGLAMGEGRSPDASRYQYPAVVLLIATAACLMEGIRLPRWVPMALLPLVVFSVASNLRGLEDGRNFLVEQTEITLAATGRLESVASDLETLTLTEEVTGARFQQLIVSGPYMRAVKRYGSPAYDEAEIAEASGPARRAAAGVDFAAAILRESSARRESEPARE